MERSSTNQVRNGYPQLREANEMTAYPVSIIVSTRNRAPLLRLNSALRINWSRM